MSRGPRGARGAALIISLILLLAMTLLAVTSLRGTILQERMGANSYDRDIAFQATEAALRLGERQAEAWAVSGISVPPDPPCPTPGATAKGMYINTQLAKNCAPLWAIAPGETGAFWHSAGNSANISGLTLTPYYIIELISTNAPCNPSAPSSALSCKRFRITATSREAGRAQVLLQSIYATQ